jgi:AraC-like DNA-binding protein
LHLVSSGEPESVADLGVAPDRSGWVVRHRAEAVAPMSRGHRHHELEVNLVLRGWAEYLIGDRRVRLAPRALGWLLPGSTHWLIDRSDDLQMWIGVFRPTLLPDGPPCDDLGPPRSWLRRPPDELPVRDVVDDCPHLDALFAQLAGADISTARHRIGLSWLLSECWRAYCAGHSAHAAGVDLHPAVTVAAQWLHDHSAEPEADDLTALAERCGISRPWLSTLFQQQLGVSLTEFRNRRRFHRFRDILVTTRPTSLTAAAFAAGFGSYAQCFRVVRAVAGCSPRQLLRQSLPPGGERR